MVAMSTFDAEQVARQFFEKNGYVEVEVWRTIPLVKIEAFQLPYGELGD